MKGAGAHECNAWDVMVAPTPRRFLIGARTCLFRERRPAAKTLRRFSSSSSVSVLVGRRRCASWQGMPGVPLANAPARQCKSSSSPRGYVERTRSSTEPCSLERAGSHHHDRCARQHTKMCRRIGFARMPMPRLILPPCIGIRVSASSVSLPICTGTLCTRDERR